MSANTLSIEVEVPSDGTIDGVEKRELHFKPLTVVPIGILRRTRNNYQDQMWEVFEWALSAEDLELLDTLPAAQLDDLLVRMQKASQVTLGE